MLVEQTSDRGKYNVIKVDWSDPEQLRYLLMQRVTNALPREQHDQVWDLVNPPLGDADSGVDRMITMSLRRPRFLIDQMERTLSFAINGFVTEGDVAEGARQMSLHLVSDFAYEMRYIAGTPEDILYSFIGCGDLLTHEKPLGILNKVSLKISVKKVIELLLWYGFLGVIDQTDKPVYIYDREYDFRRLEAERGSTTAEVLYAINPAFINGLRRD